jgi:hypothetical protein
VGNKADNRLKLGSMDANYGCLLTGDGKGGFKYMDQPISGLSVSGDVKSAVDVTINKERVIVIGAFNESLQFYENKEN